MSVVTSLLKSYKSLFCVEITATLGCPVDCLYCPQEQLRNTSKGRKRKLDYEDFKKAIDNIDIPAHLGWTGYSEPCLTPYLEKMVNYATLRNIDQYISTTLSGNSESVDFVINSKNNFSTFQLHLPDALGLMNGLKVDDSYAERLKRCLEQKVNDGLSSSVFVTCFGEDFHPLIKDIVMWAFRSGKFNKDLFSLGQIVSSRAGGLDKNKLNNLGLEANENISISSKGQFYCDKHKMNSPVLLPDGSLSICSFDYGFRETYGNLFEEKMSKIRKEWLFKVSSRFHQGDLDPCTKCEHYKTF